MNKSNPITEIFNEMPDDDLAECINEFSDWSTSGVLKSNGKFREYAQKVKPYVGENYDLTSVERNILKQASQRWLKLKLINKQ